jgi:lipoprotein-releasing system permease protein
VDRPLDDYADLIKRIDGISGIKFAIPVVEGQALVQGNIGAGSGALVRGLREEDLDKLKLVSGNIRQGTLQGFDQAGGVAIGTRMAQNLGLSIGDTLRVISPDGDVTPFGVNPRVKAYPITAIFDIACRNITHRLS